MVLMPTTINNNNSNILQWVFVCLKYICVEFYSSKFIYRIAQLCGGENIGEFGELTAICQYFTYQYFPTLIHSIGAYFYNFILEQVLVLSDCCYTCPLSYS